MKKLTTSDKKKLILFMCLVALFVLSGCQKNVDSDGYTLAERIIYLDTPWKDMLDESIFTAILVYPLAQCINWFGKITGSGVAGVAITTLAYNLIILPISIKQNISQQKMTMIQPEINKIQQKYAGKDDQTSQMRQAQELQNLYKKYDIKPMGSLGMAFLQYPFMIAMYYAAQRSAAVCEGTFMGVSLQVKPRTAITSLSENWPVVAIFVVMMGLQFLAIKIPQIMNKRALEKQKGYKKYADNNNANAQTNMMMYSMLILVGWLGFTWPASMSVYYSISATVNILKTVFIRSRV